MVLVCNSICSFISISSIGSWQYLYFYWYILFVFVFLLVYIIWCPKLWSDQLEAVEDNADGAYLDDYWNSTPSPNLQEQSKKKTEAIKTRRGKTKQMSGDA